MAGTPLHPFCVADVSLVLEIWSESLTARQRIALYELRLPADGVFDFAGGGGRGGDDGAGAGEDGSCEGTFSLSTGGTLRG